MKNAGTARRQKSNNQFSQSTEEEEKCTLREGKSGVLRAIVRPKLPSDEENQKREG